MIREILEKLFENGVFISLMLSEESKPSFLQFMKDNIPEAEPNPDPHITLIYSKKKFDGDVKIEEYSVEGNVKGFSIFGQRGERILVAEIDSEVIKNRNKNLVSEYGFISDFDEFKPHITLTYKMPEDFDIKTLPDFDTPLVFDRESVKELDLDWLKKNS